MSVRIYQLSKELKMTNSELVTLLQERGFNVKSHSSTIDSISAESLRNELSRKDETKTLKKEQSPTIPQSEQKQNSDLKSHEKCSIETLIKSKAQVEKEREDKKSKSQKLVPPTSSSDNVAIPAKENSSIAEKAPPPLAPSPSKEQKELKTLQVKTPIIVRDFAALLELKPFQLISELMELGIFASMNQSIEEDIAQEVARKQGFQLEIRHRGEQTPAPNEKEQEKKVEEPTLALESRPPVVCILGHVDHGKTTLLDTIRKTNVVANESGGITQHIGAYQITHNDHKISFIDTPGHAAFSKMRRRGAHLTDIAILVVAADDGFMPQTDEALKYAQTSQVPVIVAINKIDTPGANVDRVKQQMQERHIAPEEWGGETITVCASAIKGEGIDDILEMILLQAEMMELKTSYKTPARGTIIESQKEVGHGSTASVIVQEGVLKTGDALVSGNFFCKVRSLIDDRGDKLKEAPPARPVKIIGWSGTPESGSLFTTVKNERVAKAQAEENALQNKLAAARSKTNEESSAESEDAPSALDLLFSNIQKTQKLIFRAVVKADVYGVAEALAAALEAIQSKKIDVEIVQVGIGVISKKDAQIAAAAKAAIIGFNVGLENGVASLAKHEGIAIYRHDIIYELIDIVKEAMAEQLAPDLYEVKLGAAEVREIFSLSKGAVAGCLVTEGKIVRDSPAKLIRGGTVITEGKIGTLKRFKDDATEVRSGYECGISLYGEDNYQPKDLIECYKIEKKVAVL